MEPFSRICSFWFVWNIWRAGSYECAGFGCEVQRREVYPPGRFKIQTAEQGTLRRRGRRMAWGGLFFPKDLEVGDASGFTGFGVDAFDAHLFEHPLTVDFLRGDHFEAFCEAAVEVVAFDA